MGELPGDKKEIVAQLTKRCFGGMTTDAVRQKLRRKVVQDTINGMKIALNSTNLFVYITNYVSEKVESSDSDDAMDADYQSTNQANYHQPNFGAPMSTV